MRILQRDGRTPFTDVAKKCKVSTDAIIRRINKMKKMGIISGTTILLNPKKLGYEHIASFCIDVIKFIQKIPEVLICVPSIGRCNLFSIAIFKDINRLSEVRDLIKSYPHVKGVGTNVWVGEVLTFPENFEFKF